MHTLKLNEFTMHIINLVAYAYHNMHGRIYMVKQNFSYVFIAKITWVKDAYTNAGYLGYQGYFMHYNQRI